MPVDPKYKDWLMHCWLEVGDQSLMGADIPPEFGPNVDKTKNGFDVTLHTDDAAEARRVFEALSEGGKVVMEFAETFWSLGYGSLTDRFGIPWMVNTMPVQDWRKVAPANADAGDSTDPDAGEVLPG
jgi:PhnB protein